MMSYNFMSRWYALGFTGGLFIDAKIELFVNDIEPTPLMDFSNFDVPGYAGYLGQDANVLGNPFIEGDGSIWFEFQSVNFQPTDSVVQSTIFGWLMTGSAGGTGIRMLTAARFPAPIALLGPQTALNFSPWIEFPQGTSAGPPAP